MKTEDSWNFVISYFEDLAAQKTDFLILLELCKKLAKSEYATQLYPSVSVGVLNLFGTDNFRDVPYGPAISIKHLANNEVKISYAINPKDTKNYTTRVCYSTDVWDCLKSFILRLHFDTNEDNK